MGQYFQIEFEGISQEQCDVLIAQLNEIGFEGFEEKENGLKAFIPSENFDEASLTRIAGSLRLNFSKAVIGETNWNQLWESNFEPVVVDDFVAIRADFHQPIKNVQLEIIITPKMSFGTGHHATTYMMVEQLREIDFTDKTVFDFGTGTGVLAIVAEKLGARKVLAIDNDEWSIVNAGENIERNGCSRIDLKLANAPVRNQRFDIILANINKNVIFDNFEVLAAQLSADGILLLSGLLSEDKEDILMAGKRSGLKFIKKAQRDGWLLLKLTP